ncbi:LpxI family protein [Paroceanicella profunda]|uniref:LpxI family protein n=1 Tax=Paroceanicella profunda TaxID=2579971 RepID=A0A5B8FVC0_9RHOB|nr:UDP-2,3-diacylglucosamine diphosphatase LpxI [Paroceanicella profunda]QDL92746.1 LpxI family protein [Paroceanicella profunda]
MRLGIIAGTGALPRLIAEEERRLGRPPLVVTFEGTEIDWLSGFDHVHLPFEKAGRLFRALRGAGCETLTFAGAMQRPRLNPIRFDFAAVRIAAKVFQLLKSGDDAMLRGFAAVLEAEGFRVAAPHSFLQGLLAEEGVLTRQQPSEADRADAARAALLARHLGAADVGQGAVVAQGLCLGLETLQGTDAMLDFVARTAPGLRPDPEGGRGVLLKAPKPGQDWRVDLPAIGAHTLKGAHAAGLAGVVVEAGGVLLLGRDELIAEADRLGLFLWGRPVTVTDQAS